MICPRRMGDMTKEEFEQWLTPTQAFDALSGQWGSVTTYHALTERLRNDLLHACSEVAIVTKYGREISREVMDPIPFHHWRENVGPGYRASFWRTGNFEIRSSGGHDSSFTYIGTRFDPGAVHALIERLHTPSLIATPRLGADPQTPPAKHAGGAPPKAWWDDLWIEIFRQIHCGDLQFKRQADIEKAMLDWANANGHKMSETTARNAARKLFNALSQEG